MESILDQEGSAHSDCISGQCGSCIPRVIEGMTSLVLEREQTENWFSPTVQTNTTKRLWHLLQLLYLGNVNVGSKYSSSCGQLTKQSERHIN